MIKQYTQLDADMIPIFELSDKELKIAMINMLKDLAEKSTIYMNNWRIPAER